MNHQKNAERLLKKIQIKESSGLDDSKDFTQMLVEMAGGENTLLKHDQGMQDRRTMLNFASKFDYVPSQNTIDNLYVCAKELKRIADSMQKCLEPFDTKELYRLEELLHALWGFLALEGCKYTVKEYELSYENPVLGEMLLQMTEQLYDLEAQERQITKAEYRDYYEIETSVIRKSAELLENALNKDDKNEIGFISFNATCVLPIRCKVMMKRHLS